jgi:hypothetical protein
MSFMRANSGFGFAPKTALCFKTIWSYFTVAGVG